MASSVCPVCGDPRVYRFWGEKKPPEACAFDEVWAKGGPPTIRNVTECDYQMRRARQAAAFRRLVPDAFDASGNMLPGQIGRVLEAWQKENPNGVLAL